MRFPTATLGEERALAAVREGAAHYILKDRLQRLVSTVKRALGASAERPRAPPLASVARLASGIAHDVTNVRPPILLGVPLLRAHITAPRRSPAPRDIRKKRRARRRPRPPDPPLRPGASAANPARSRSHRSAATSARSPAKPFPPTSAATPASAPTFGPSPPAPPKSTQASSISASPPATPCAAAAPSPSARKTSSATTSPCAPAPAQRSCGRSRTRAPAFCPTCSPRSGMLATRPNKTAKAPAKPPTSASPRSAAWSPPPRRLRHGPAPSRRGTTFRIFHPAAEGALGETPVPASVAVLRGNGELRLVVAEVNIRNVTTSPASHSGYRVIAARDVRRLKPTVKILAARGPRSIGRPGAPARLRRRVARKTRPRRDRPAHRPRPPPNPTAPPPPEPPTPPEIPAALFVQK